MSTLPLTTIPQPRTDLEEELIGDELFVRDLDSHSTIHCLNSGATMIWYLCNGERDLQTIAAEIAATTSRSTADILPEVQAAVAQFHELGLLSEA